MQNLASSHSLAVRDRGQAIYDGSGLPPGKVGLLLPAVVSQSEKTCMQLVNKKRVPPEKAGLDSSHKRVLFDESIPTRRELTPERGGAPGQAHPDQAVRVDQCCLKKFKQS